MGSRAICGFASNALDGGNTASPWFVTISKDQRVKVWNTASGALHQHLTEAQHLGSIYTCTSVFAGVPATVRFIFIFACAVKRVPVSLQSARGGVGHCCASPPVPASMF
jgi:hypothetical protein